MLEPSIGLADWIEVAYCATGPFDNSWGTGTTRLHARELANWLYDRISAGCPVLVTDIKILVKKT
jgi:hypothetical protein